MLLRKIKKKKKNRFVLVLNVNRVDKEKVQYSFGLREMAVTTRTLATVMDTRTVFIPCQFQVSLKQGKF